MPVAPVQAFAFPLFTTTARISAERRWFAETRTGAAFILLVVNVAAATAGKSETIRARSGPGFVSPLIPHRTAEARNPLGDVTPPLISVKAKAISVKSLQYLRAGLGSKTIILCFFIVGGDALERCLACEAVVRPRGAAL